MAKTIQRMLTVAEQHYEKNKRLGHKTLTDIWFGRVDALREVLTLVQAVDRIR